MIKSEKTLYICGGASASVFTAGMTVEMKAHSKIDSYEYLVGASSGAFSLCYVAGDDIYNGADGYWDMLPYFYRDPQFFSFKRLLQRKSIMDVRYLVTVGLTQSQYNPIPWQKVLESRWNKQGKMLIQIMDVDTGMPFFCSHFKTVEALQEAVIASCAIPFVAAIRAHQMNTETWHNMTLRNHKGEIFDKKTDRCYDGEVPDMYFRHAQSWIDSKQTTILTTAYSDNSNKVFIFGKLLVPLEYILGHPMFFGYFRATHEYHVERIFGRATRYLKELVVASQEDPHKLQVVTLPRSVSSIMDDVYSSKQMKEHLQDGRNLMKKWIPYL